MNIPDHRHVADCRLFLPVRASLNIVLFASALVGSRLTYRVGCSLGTSLGASLNIFSTGAFAGILLPFQVDHLLGTYLL